MCGRRLAGTAACCLLVVALGCSGAQRSGRKPVDIQLTDFHVGLPSTSLSAGRHVLRVENLGPSTHEIIVDRTDRADGDLPLLGDGLTVNEESPDLRRVGGMEVIRLHDTPQLQLDLSPGHYVLYCNLEGHYLGKMHASLDVT